MYSGNNPNEYVVWLDIIYFLSFLEEKECLLSLSFVVWMELASLALEVSHD